MGTLDGALDDWGSRQVQGRHREQAVAAFDLPHASRIQPLEMDVTTIQPRESLSEPQRGGGTFSQAPTHPPSV